MSFFKVHSAQAELISAHKVEVEIDISNGLYNFSIVGLGDKAIGEAKDRIASAIKYSGFKSPKQKNQKVVISLAPANKRKTGPSFDLPMAVGYLAASKEIIFNSAHKLFVGELSLNGETCKTAGVMQITTFAKQNNFTEIYVPFENAEEAGFIEGISVYAVKNLEDLVLHLKGEKLIKPYKKITGDDRNGKNHTDKNSLSKESEQISVIESKPVIDFAEIIGQEIAKRGLLIAASGKHNVAFYGPPGTGKSMLARAFSGILPNLNIQETIETTSIYSASGLLKNNLITEAPFRSPHHTSSYSAIVGGGSHSKPGEITLAHNGLLFLDELPEFDKRVINSLRQPLEEKQISISRTNETVNYPANFILVAAMNPCHCGYYKTNIKNCVCSPNNIENYQRKISGPIIDRIDLWIEVTNLKQNEILKTKNLNTKGLSAVYKKQVAVCREIQYTRNKKLNGELENKELATFALNQESEQLLFQIFEKYKLSMRSFYKILKVARTIADLEQSIEIKKPHILEAVQFRYKK
jgi:magnesium chelatase family protein